MKYITMTTGGGLRLPFLFPERLIHAEMAKVIAFSIMRTLNDGSRPVSAGFVSIGQCNTYGESETLKGLKSNASDPARIIIGSSCEFMPDAEVIRTLEMLARSRKQ